MVADGGVCAWAWIEARACTPASCSAGGHREERQRIQTGARTPTGPYCAHESASHAAHTAAGILRADREACTHPDAPPLLACCVKPCAYLYLVKLHCSFDEVLCNGEPSFIVYMLLLCIVEPVRETSEDDFGSTGQASAWSLPYSTSCNSRLQACAYGPRKVAADGPVCALRPHPGLININNAISGNQGF